jgi:lipopolysaccharide export system protein LptA
MGIGIGIAQAAPSPVMGKHDANQPINVSSDHFTAEKSPAAGNMAPAVLTYSGNVVITQGEIRMRANDVKINVIGGKPDKIYANGNVVVNSASGVATGDNGVYDVSPRLVTLTGHVVLTKEKNVMRGQRLTVNLVTGVANLGAGGAAATGTAAGGGRVQAVFTPPPQAGGK